MKRLIVTSTDSGAGCLKASRIADKVVCLGHALVCGPVPFESDANAFFEARAKLRYADTEDWETAIDDQACQAIDDILSESKGFDSIELWMDPDANSQLQLIQVLDSLRRYPALTPKVRIYHSELRFGLQKPESLPRLPTLQMPNPEVLELASLSWRAFSQPTPESWFGLTQKQAFDGLPYLGITIARMLRELPSASTGLSETQTAMLELVSTGKATPRHIHGKLIDGEGVFNYWENGRLLEGLAYCAKPAIAGLAAEKFNLSLHDNVRLYIQYMRSKLTLTMFGYSLLADEDDFSAYNVIHRWWGGTQITNKNLWRWAKRNGELVPPRGA
jgi:Domain of unknown function (DUF1835)